MITGAGNCVSCHIAIPHGWKRPRLLVYSNDPAPYVGAQPAGAASSVFTVAGGTQHLDGINADASATKDDTMGVASTYASADATAGTHWGNWSTTGLGTGWNADPAVGVPGSTQNTAVQNNCNACTGTGTTHTPANEGFTTATPSWK